jgi:hypothetical protein
MEYSLRYRSTRAEVWRWYLSAWKSRLWIFHAAFSVGIAGLLCAKVLPDANLVVLLMLAMALMPVVFLFFAAYPQVLFKPQERQLTLDAGGWTTRIGKQSGARAWAEIARVEERPDSVVITSRGGNALIVPTRALPDPKDWGRFVADLKAWHRAARPS